VQFVLILPPRQLKVEKFEEKEDQEQKQSKSNENKFQCQQCLKSYKTRLYLYLHMKSHEPKVKCQICSKEVRRACLKGHLKLHQDFKDFNCDHCAAAFVIKQNLVVHMRKHRSDKKFNCTQCNRGFNDRQYFKNSSSVTLNRSATFPV
jgi:KRAB domain-containing zinc finger protein